MTTTRNPAHLVWGIKRVNHDGTTGSTRLGLSPTITWPVNTGGWVDHPDAAQLWRGGACGPGLHVAKDWYGASQGGCLTNALGLVVGWHPGDVLGEDEHKVRVRRCLVVPGAHSWVEVARRWGRGADFTGAALFDADFTGADFTDANFTGANFSGANLTGTNLTWTNFTGSYLVGANFTGANFSGANLTWTNFIGSYLVGANFTGANFSGADLTRTNLTGSYLVGANFTGAIADASTIWPVNFDPVARGL